MNTNIEFMNHWSALMIAFPDVYGTIKSVDDYIHNSLSWGNIEIMHVDEDIKLAKW